MAASGRELGFRIALVTLCVAALVELGAIVYVDRGIAWSRNNAVLGAVGLFCAWLIFAAVRRFRTSRIEKVFLLAAMVLFAAVNFVIGLGRVSAEHQVDGGIQMLCGAVTAVPGVRAFMRMMKRDSSTSGGEDDV